MTILIGEHTTQSLVVLFLVKHTKLALTDCLRDILLARLYFTILNFRLISLIWHNLIYAESNLTTLNVILILLKPH